LDAILHIKHVLHIQISAPMPYYRSRQQSHQITSVRSKIKVALPHFRYIYHITNIPAKDHAWQDFVPLSTQTLLNWATICIGS